MCKYLTLDVWEYSVKIIVCALGLIQWKSAFFHLLSGTGSLLLWASRWVKTQMHQCAWVMKTDWVWKELNKYLTEIFLAGRLINFRMTWSFSWLTFFAYALFKLNACYSVSSLGFILLQKWLWLWNKNNLLQPVTRTVLIPESLLVSLTPHTINHVHFVCKRLSETVWSQLFLWHFMRS